MGKSDLLAPLTFFKAILSGCGAFKTKETLSRLCERNDNAFTPNIYYIYIYPYSCFHFVNEINKLPEMFARGEKGHPDWFPERSVFFSNRSLVN